MAESSPLYRRWLFALASLLVLSTFAMMALGGAVTSHNAGMAVPGGFTTAGSWSLITPVNDWWHAFDTRLEHAHRLLGYVVGLAAIAFVVGVWLPSTAQRGWVKVLAVVVLLFVVAQGVLGAYRVNHNSLLLAGIHGVTGQIYLGLTVLAAAAVGRRWTRRDPAQGRGPFVARVLTLGLLAALLLQLTLGSAVRHSHSALAIPDWPLHYGQVMPPMDDQALAALADPPALHPPGHGLRSLLGRAGRVGVHARALRRPEPWAGARARAAAGAFDVHPGDAGHRHRGLGRRRQLRHPAPDLRRRPAGHRGVAGGAGADHPRRSRGVTPATPTTARAAGSDMPAVPSRLADYKALLKLGIARMVVITTAVGFLLAHRAGYTDWSWGGMVGVLAGTGLSCMAASVLNQVWERRTDALMPRTARRPLARPNEPVPVSEALALAAALTLLGQGLVCLCGTPLASGLAAATIVGYVLVYTPLKKRTRAALYLGGIPGAIPPLIGYAAVSGTLLGSAAATAWILFAIMFVWQLPHFLAIGYLYRDDYAAGGMHMHAVLDPTGRSSYQESIVWCVVLLPLGALPTLLGHSGYVSLAVTLAAGIAFLWTALRWRQRTLDDTATPQDRRAAARRMFFASLIYLPVVLTAIMADAR